jgi:hypothetical protein
MIGEAELAEVAPRLVPVKDGWFAVNVRDAAWEQTEAGSAACFFEGGDAPFAQIGINVRVLSRTLEIPVPRRIEPGGLSRARR